jgi:hypothetical protein
MNKQEREQREVEVLQRGRAARRVRALHLCLCVL